MHAVLRSIESLAARVAVTLILSATALISGIARRLRRPAALTTDKNKPPKPLRILLAGTFYNDAWFDAHVEPLLACNAIDHVTVVTDMALKTQARVTYATPPQWLTRIIGRAAARLLWTFNAARTNRCDLLVGYHIMPNALICLIVGRLLGRRCAYQMTGGPVQLIAGGVGSENALLRRQRTPGRLRERLMHHLARQFDMVIVRGRKGADYMRQLGAEARTTTIPAGIDMTRFAPRDIGAADFELISVGRLVHVKRYDRLLHIVAALAKRRPDVGCAFVGDGPLRSDLDTLAKQLGVERNVRFMGRRDDVASLLLRARLFVLTSDSEGQSIAMMEAMAAGLPVAAPDVGELTDLLRDGESGIVIHPEHADSAAEKIDALLSDAELMTHMATAGHNAVAEFAATQAVGRKWMEALERLSTIPRPAASADNSVSQHSTTKQAALAGSAPGNDT